MSIETRFLERENCVTDEKACCVSSTKKKWRVGVGDGGWGMGWGVGAKCFYFRKRFERFAIFSLNSAIGLHYIYATRLCTEKWGGGLYYARPPPPLSNFGGGA